MTKYKLTFKAQDSVPIIWKFKSSLKDIDANEPFASDMLSVVDFISKQYPDAVKIVANRDMSKSVKFHQLVITVSMIEELGIDFIGYHIRYVPRKFLELKYRFKDKRVVEPYIPLTSKEQEFFEREGYGITPKLSKATKIANIDYDAFPELDEEVKEWLEKNKFKLSSVIKDIDNKMLKYLSPDRPYYIGFEVHKRFIEVTSTEPLAIDLLKMLDYLRKYRLSETHMTAYKQNLEDWWE